MDGGPDGQDRPVHRNGHRDGQGHGGPPQYPAGQPAPCRVAARRVGGAPALAWFPATRREVRREHWPLPDPTALGGPEDTVLREGRRVRDQIRRRVEALLDSLGRAS